MQLTVGSGQLPKGWEVKKLGEICEIEKNQGIYNNLPYVGMENIESNTARFIGSYQPQTVKSSTFRFNPNHILYGRLRPYLNKVLAPNFEGHCSTEIFPIKPSECLSKNFLLYWLLMDSTVNNINKTCTGARMPRANMTAVFEFDFPVPPLPEQKRIVAILDEAFEGIDRAISNTEKNLSNARELFESYLNFKLFAVASNKPTQTLSCITDLIIDCEHKTAPTQETGIPSIRTPNIGKGYLIFDNVNRVSEETYKMWTRRGKPEPGDLILAREAPAGNVGVIPEGYKVCLGQRTVLIRPNKKSVDSEYLAFLLLHPLMQKRLLAKSTGATVQHVNMKDIRELAISELPPIQTQRDCIQDLKQLESQSNRLENIYRQKIAALKELKQSILQKAFTGELTVDKGELAKEEIAA
ncbi:restriction endonuclease subunit S [Sphaerospermopsis kisseleviana CS-549]|uniref:Restriction endonuclease subunit S n=1 Tax=Sphaerospermopsis kisseleviana CS-549 TaxID=3021783 RepID=A0ABT4ZN38_9CYAN|nr:restriction endonuclease subunit S [Sphaerospermopsis kisseleviana]MDB9440621.1 restriction endonuclease subunit S [Sphaerospermopsis kisseleviana CS-549]BAZ83160.1 type 1 restriction-modification system specificity subunit [Sphaerospermopsis kisseleviana NIES-73]